MQGFPVCFDAKECNTDTFPLANIHPHQMDFMGEFERQGGIAFLILFFTARNEFYYLKYSRIQEFFTRAQQGGRKRFSHDELDPDYILCNKNGFLVPYLDGLQKDILSRD